jgi:hypothetical protein
MTYAAKYMRVAYCMLLIFVFLTCLNDAIHCAILHEWISAVASFTSMAWFSWLVWRIIP